MGVPCQEYRAHPAFAKPFNQSIIAHLTERTAPSTRFNAGGIGTSPAVSIRGDSLMVLTAITALVP